MSIFYKTLPKRKTCACGRQQWAVPPNAFLTDEGWKFECLCGRILKLNEIDFKKEKKPSCDFSDLPDGAA